MTTVTCPDCRKQVSLTNEQIGAILSCPQCGRKVRVAVAAPKGAPGREALQSVESPARQRGLPPAADRGAPAAPPAIRGRAAPGGSATNRSARFLIMGAVLAAVAAS